MKEQNEDPENKQDQNHGKTEVKPPKKPTMFGDAEDEEYNTDHKNKSTKKQNKN